METAGAERAGGQEGRAERRLVGGGSQRRLVDWLRRSLTRG